MLQVLKFNGKDDQIWFSSDYHWNHDPQWGTPIWKLRGFSSIQESNEYIINKTNELIKPNDIFIHVGDLTLNTTEEKFETFIDRINCQNIFSMHGNHPNPSAKIYKKQIELQFKIDSEKHEIYPLKYKNITFLPNYVEFIINRQFIVACHYPISIFNHQARLGWHITGHSHHAFNGSLPSNKQGKICDIGFDGFKRPINFGELRQIMNGKEYVKVDGHH